MVHGAILSATRRLERNGRGDPSKDDAHCDEAQIIDEGDCMRMRRGHLMRDAIIGTQWQSSTRATACASVVIGGHQWPLVVISGHRAVDGEEQPARAQPAPLALRASTPTGDEHAARGPERCAPDEGRNQTQSDALRRNQSQSAARGPNRCARDADAPITALEDFAHTRGEHRERDRLLGLDAPVGKRTRAPW